jgi:hypothetical protein
MKRPLAAFGVSLILASDATAHRLDEYLQATRLDVARDRLALELDLTPGSSLADVVFGVIDRDADGVVSTVELEDYARAVLRDLVVDVDGISHRVNLTRAECPSWPEFRDGVGTIRVEASSATALAVGRHQIRFRNLHRPEISVYLANALLPASRDVAIVAQARDARQQSFELDIAVRGSRSRSAWIVVQFMLFAGALAYRSTMRSRRGGVG